jgi:ribosomal protein S18 acetylase RimI-like enzyme
MRRHAVLSISFAEPADAPALAALQSSAADDLTRLHGRGHWSSCPSEASALRGLRASRVLVARRGDHLVGTVRLATRKPWAIDLSYFTAVPRAVYLHDLAVAPQMQHQGIGHSLIDEAKAVARAWPSEAIRLDAYDHAAGAGEFYRGCGFREVGRVIYRRVPLVYFEWVV